MIIGKRNQSFTQVLTNYFQAIVKELSIIDTIELKATQRTGGFIGIFDGLIGSTDYKDMKKLIMKIFLDANICLDLSHLITIGLYFPEVVSPLKEMIP